MQNGHTVKHDGCIGTNEDSTGTSSTGRSGSTLSVHSDVTGNDDSVATVPGVGLHPVDGVEEGSSTTVAGVLGVDTLNVEVAGLSEEVHEGSLDGLGLVNDGLSANINTTNGLGVDVVLFEETRDG